MKRYKHLIYIILSLIILIVTISSASSVWIVIRNQRQVIETQNRTTYVESLNRPTPSFPLTLNWRVDLGRYTYEYPAYQDGLVLMPADDSSTNHWYGIDASTGQVIWQQATADHNYRRCLTDKYLVLSSPRSFMNLKTHTGEIIWQKDRAGTASCSNEVVFYSEVPRYSISAADLSTGQDFWMGTEPEKEFSGLIYNSETEEIITDESTVPGYLYIVDAGNGELKRSFNVTVFPSLGGPPWERGPMYLIDRGELFAGEKIIDTRSGRVIHEEERYGSGLSPTVTMDTVYLASLSDGVVALDRTAYNIKWIYPSPVSKLGSNPLETISSVAILDGIGYVIFADATLRAFDLENGQELGYWQPSQEDLMDWLICIYPNPRSDCIESARAGLATSEDTLFVSFGDGKLYAFGK